jgi:dephospho-CoA kinase
VKRVLITGMSGTGKSSVIERLAELGYKAVDTDDGGYSEIVALDPTDPRSLGSSEEWRWNEGRIGALLDADDADVLFVSGTSSNQSMFYPRFDHIVLLSAPDALMAARMRTRTNNPYGKDPSEIARQLRLKPVVEGWLRKAADLEIDTSASLDDVVANIVAWTVGPRG